MGKIAPAVTAVCGVFLIVGFVLFGVLFEQAVDQQLEDMAYVCDKGSDFYSSWKDSEDAGARLRRNFYFYNIANPTEALNGGSFKLVEVGPFSFEFTGKKFDIEFKKGGTVHYREYQRLSFSKKHSCDECTETYPLTTVNIAWQTILVDAQSEGLLALASTCSQVQLLNIVANPTADVCTPAQIQSQDATCKCCDPAFGCANLVNPANNMVTAMISYLAKFDSSAVVSTDAPNAGFPVLDGVYSPTIVTTSPRGIIGGRPSALLGFMQARAALTSGPDTDTLLSLDRFTRDYYDACKSYCPDPTQYVADFMALGSEPEKIQLLRSTVCSGTIAEKDTTKNYLVGMSCEAATPTFFGVAFATVYTCADGSTTKPCCMTSATMAPFGGQPIPGWGCVRELPGYLLTRKTDSQEEYAETNTWEFEQKTGCKGTSESEAQDMVEFKSKTEFNVWYTPTSYTFPNMPYADTMPVKSIKDGATVDGELTSFQVVGKDVGVKKPKGFSTDFFEYQGSDGKMSGENINIFSRTLQQPIEFTFDRKSTVKGINVAKFTMDFVKLTNQTEENQRKGFGVPYSGVYAGLQYAMSVPAFVSFPHFYQGDPDALTQSDNSQLFTASSSGIEMSSRVRSYSEPGSLRAPEDAVAITADYMEANKDLYDVSLYIDPWSGKSLASTVVLMISTTMWRCNPTANQQGCGLFRMSAADLCYPPAGGVGFPCSASNVFSPKMIGGKIIPNFFVTEKSEVDDETADTFKTAFATRQASHIMLVVGVVIGVALLAAAAYLVSQDSTAKTMERIGSKPENIAPRDGTSAKAATIEMEGKDTW